MEERFCPSHCLICLGKALTSNTNLNDSSGNLGSVSEARLGLAQWPSLGEHGKFAGSICHSQHELRKRTRKEWLNGLDPWLALVDVRRSAALVVLWDYRKLYQAGTLSSWMHPTFQSNESKKKKKNRRQFSNSRNISLLILEVIEYFFSEYRTSAVQFTLYQCKKYNTSIAFNKVSLNVIINDKAIILLGVRVKKSPFRHPAG